MTFTFACNFSPLLWRQDKDKDEDKPKERDKDEEKQIYICLFCKLSPLLWRQGKYKDEDKPKERDKDEEQEKFYTRLFRKLSPLLWRHAQFPFHNRRHLQRVLGTVENFRVLSKIFVLHHYIAEMCQLCDFLPVVNASP